MSTQTRPTDTTTLQRPTERLNDVEENGTLFPALRRE